MEELENPRLVRLWILAGLFWAMAVPAVWIALSFPLHSPGILPEEPWLSFGRLWPVASNALVFGLFSSLAFGLCAHMVPRLTGVPMAFGGLGWLSWLLWNAGVLLGCALLATDGGRGIPGFDRPAWMDPLFSGSQGIELGEFPLGIDILLTLCFLLTTVQVIVTLLRRAEPMMYASLWYTAGALIWTTLTYGLGNLLVPHLIGGLRETALHGAYLSNLLGLWVVPMGTAAAYYFVPPAADAPLFSHRLAFIGFWTLVLFQPIVSVAPYLLTPIPEWQQTLSIVAGVCVLLPAWATVCNVFITLWGRWDKVRTSAALKFLALGTAFYGVGSLMAATLSFRDVQQLLQFTSYPDAAWLAVAGGGGVLWIVGGAYAAWERTAGRELFSEDLGHWHFCLTLLGLGGLVIVLAAAGLVQGNMLRYGADFVDALAAQRWAWFARTGAGVLLALGGMLFFFNLLLTTRHAAEA